jgi:hypothetical protein
VSAADLLVIATQDQRNPLPSGTTANYVIEVVNLGPSASLPSTLNINVILRGWVAGGPEPPNWPPLPPTCRVLNTFRLYNGACQIPALAPNQRYRITTRAEYAGGNGNFGMLLTILPNFSNGQRAASPVRDLRPGNNAVTLVTNWR